MEKRKHILAIINPVSGVGSKDKIPRLIETVVDNEKNDVSIVMSEYAGHAHEIAEMAVAEGIDVVVAIGGDGTVKTQTTQRRVPVIEGAPLVINQSNSDRNPRDRQWPHHPHMR